MSLTRSGAIIRRLPLSRSHRLATLSTPGTDMRSGTLFSPAGDSQAVSSSLHSTFQNSCRRSWSSSAFFSTAPSADLLEEDEYYNENSRENRSFGTSTTTKTSADTGYEKSTLDRIVSGGFVEYQSVDVDSFVTEDYLKRLVDDHISNSKVPPNPNMLLNMLELLHNEETHISSDIVVKIFREVVRSKRVKLLARAEEVVVKNRYDPRLLRLLVTGYVNAGDPRRACKLLMEWPNESIKHQPGIESYRRVLTALGSPPKYHNGTKQQKGTRRNRQNSGPHNPRKNQINGEDDNATNNIINNDDQDVLVTNHRLARQLLQHMCQTHIKFPQLSLAPDRDCFHRVLGACSSIEALSTAREILDEMTQFAGGGNDVAAMKTEGNAIDAPTLIDTQPNESTMRLLVKVWSTVSGGKKEIIEMQKEAFEFLRRIEAEALSQHRRQDSDSSSPTLASPIVDIDCYNVLLNNLAELGQYEMSENMFRRLLGDYMKGEKSNVQPDMVTLNTVLKSHVQVHTEAAAVSAERFLERLDAIYEQQERIRKSKRFIIDDDYDDTPRVVYEIQPTARARSIISNLWVKLGDPHRAAEILAKAEEVYREKEQQLIYLQQQNVETAHLYSLDTIKRFRPDKITYRQIIGALCKLQDPPTSHLATKAEETGNRMCKMGHRLNLLTCNTILNCWTKSGDPDRAEIYLEETMQEHNVVPDTVSYNTIIHGHARLGNLDRALELLTRLLDDALTNSQNTDRSRHQGSLYPKPNVRTFTNILIALSQEKTVKAAEEAEHLLVRMQELNDPPYNLDTRPNTITYNAVMNCWATLSLPSSRRQRKNQQQSTNDNEHHRFGHKADFVLRSMQGLGKNERPNAISYNIVIRAYSNDMNKAEELVQDMISNGIEPTDHTYNTLVHVLNRDFTIKDKDKKLEELRDLYFASSSFPLENGRSPNKNRNAGKKRNNGNNNGKKTKNNSGRRRQQ